MEQWALRCGGAWELRREGQGAGRRWGEAGIEDTQVHEVTLTCGGHKQRQREAAPRKGQGPRSGRHDRLPGGGGAEVDSRLGLV